MAFVQKKGSKLGKAKHFLPKDSNMIIIFLNTDCDMARPNERIIDNNGDMEGDTSTDGFALIQA